MRRLVVSFWIIAFCLCGCDQALRNILNISSDGSTTIGSSTRLFDWIGGSYTPLWGWLTGKVTRGYSDLPENLSLINVFAVDSTNGFIYAANSGGILKINLSTGVPVGMIGGMRGSYGTCPQFNAANGWCTGGLRYANSLDGEFAVPSAIVVDPTNDFLYVADTNNGRIVKLKASTGDFIGAIGVTSASTGTCPASGVTSGWCTGGSFTSGGDGSLDSTTSLAIDVAGDAMYVARYRRIDKFILSTGVFVGSVGKTSSTTGTCPAGVATAWCTGGTFVYNSNDGAYGTIGQLAVDHANGFLYVADSDYYKVNKLNLSTGAFIGAIGSTSASSGTCPASGVATGWCTGGTFTSDSSDGGFDWAWGLALDATNDTLYVSDYNWNRVNKFVLSSGAFVGAVGKTTATSGTCPASGAAPGWCTGGSFAFGAGDGMFHVPKTLALDSVNSHLLIADSSNSRIASINKSTGAFIGAIGNPISGEGVTSMWSNGSSTLISLYGTGDGQFDYAADVAVDSVNGFVYVVDYNNARVQKFSLATGAFIGAIGKLTASTGSCPASGAASAWCTGGTFQSGAGDGMFTQPQQIALDVTHDVFYIADKANNRIQKFVASSGAFIGAIGNLVGSTGTCPASGAAPGWCTGGTFDWGVGDGQYQWVGAVAIDPVNNILYIGDGNPRIAKVNASTGAFIGAIGQTSASSGTCPASGVATTWCTGGTFAYNGQDGTFDSVFGMAIDLVNGHLYVGDNTYKKIQKFNLSTGAFIGAIGDLNASSGTCPSSGTAPGWCTGGGFNYGTADGQFDSFAGSFVVDSANDALYVGGPGTIRVQKIRLSTGAFIGAIGFATSSTGTCTLGPNATWCTGGTFGLGGYQEGALEYPSGIAMDSAGNLYVADDIRIVRITP